MILSLRYLKGAKTFLGALFLLAILLCGSTYGADKDKEKKPEKEKKEKIETWVEIRTPHFIVASDGGEKTARRIANEFETLIRVFQATMPNARVSTGVPVRILAPKNGESFAHLAPEFPFDNRHEQPPGLAIFGQDKSFIVVRANASGHYPYIEIFQNYSREVLKLSYRNLPVWLEEGYSTVYGNLSFSDRGVRLQRPDPEDLSVLYESPLLPLDLVLKVDRKSPYYSPGNKNSVYFAESRVLVHFLISDPQFAGTKSMERYIADVRSGTDSLQAARDAFGDLNQLQTKLEAFIKQVNPSPADLSIAAGSDSGSPVRTLTAAEIEARSADFLALRGRNEDAQDKLEEALASEPSLAEAEQSMGFIALKKDDLDEAQKHFDRAAQLDPKDALNFYGQGLVAVAKSGNAGVAAGATDAFEKTVALNADFAPAWYNLAMIYSEKNETLAKALADARRAASLAPGEQNYQMQLEAIQDRANNPDQARTTAARAKESASARSTADKSGDVIAQTSRPQSSATPSPGAIGNAPGKPASDTVLRIERKTEPEAKPSSASTGSATEQAGAVAEPVRPAFSPTKVYSMVGTITDVNCANAPQIQITMKSLTIVMKLHAVELAKVSFKSAGSDADVKGATCTSLRGRSARVSYVLVLNQPWDGELQEVEFRSQP
jgi:tetratricopeptide (TPR) repeat protein